MRTFICDMDGVLINTSVAFSKCWTDILGVEILPTDFISWKHEWALGIDPSLLDEFWSKVWDYPAPMYPYTEQFIRKIKNMGYRFQILTSRGGKEAGIALTRDLKPLRPLVDELIVCDQHGKGDKKSDFINACPDALFFLDDHIKNAVDAKLHSPHLKEVMLITRPWNTSADLVGYLRVRSYIQVLCRLRIEDQ